MHRLETKLLKCWCWRTLDLVTTSPHDELLEQDARRLLWFCDILPSCKYPQDQRHQIRRLFSADRGERTECIWTAAIQSQRFDMLPATWCKLEARRGGLGRRCGGCGEVGGKEAKRFRGQTFVPCAKPFLIAAFNACRTSRLRRFTSSASALNLRLLRD